MQAQLMHDASPQTNQPLPQDARRSMQRAWFTSALAGVSLLGVVIACDNVSGPRSEPVSMTFSVPSFGALNIGDVTLESSAQGDIVVVRGSQRLRLDIVELTF